MTLVTGTVQDLGYDGMEGTLWARPARFRSDGQVVYAPERKPYTITGGVVSAELAPGPAVLELQVGSHARGTFEVVIPEEDTTLADLLDTVFPWEPAQVSLFVAAREAAEQAASDAEAAAGQATTAAQQTGQDRSHVDQVRTELDEAFDESTAGNVLPPRLTEAALNNTYPAKQETEDRLAEHADSLVRVGRVIRNVQDYGAKCDGHTDDSAAVQAAINAGGTVIFPPGVTLAHGLMARHGMTLEGTGQWQDKGVNAAVLMTVNGDLFVTPPASGSARFGEIISQASFRHMAFRSQDASSTQGGRLFTGRWANSTFHSCDHYQSHKAVQAFDVTAWLNVNSYDCTYAHDPASTAAMFRAVAYGDSATGTADADVNIAGSTWKNSAIYSCGTWSFWIECQGGTIATGLRWERPIFETCNGGGLVLLGCLNPVIESPQFWDFTATPTANLIAFGTYSGATPSPSVPTIQPEVNNYFRDDSVDLGSAEDIHLDANVHGFVIRNPRHYNSGKRIVVNVNGNAGRLQGSEATMTVLGASTAELAMNEYYRPPRLSTRPVLPNDTMHQGAMWVNSATADLERWIGKYQKVDFTDI